MLVYIPVDQAGCSEMACVAECAGERVGRTFEWSQCLVRGSMEVEES